MQTNNTPAYEPTREEIAEACREIQAEWSDRERQRRAGLDPDRRSTWTPPEVALHQPA